MTKKKNSKIQLVTEPQGKNSLDPSQKKKPGMSNPMFPLIGPNGKPYRVIGASLGATIPIEAEDGSKQYLRLDAWEQRLVEDDPKKVEKEKRKLFRDLIEELQIQAQEAEEELS